jgi:16S rRNA (cytosine967-C5)-methyltransferase
MPTQKNKDTIQSPGFSEEEKSNAESDILAARLCALEILDLVINQRQMLDHALENTQDFIKLSPRDRAFVRMLAATTLRRMGQIDDLIARAQERPESLKSLQLKNILRLGTCQLFFTDVPDHAAVDTSVNLAELIGMDRQKGFVNALLRTLIRSGKDWMGKQDASRLNTPEWLLKIWIADYSLREAAEIAAANMAEAPLDITVKDNKDSAYWAATLKASVLSTGTLRRMAGGNIREMEGFDQGQWWIQDAAAALPAKLLGPLEGETVLDICAAPGGKTLQLASMGAHVIALDRSAQRLKRLEENVKRMNLQDRVQVIAADATVWSPPKNEPAPQRILLDAPCSATGTIRRHPDLPHLKTPRDMEGLIAVQSRLLAQAGKILGIGGLLIYCACSLQKDEGERQVDSFLCQNPNFQRVPITPEEIGNYTELIDPNGDLRILPFHLAAQGGIDGFYVARLTRNS